MLVIIGCALLAVWLFGVLIFKITKGIIHIVLLIAVVAIIVHFVRTA